MSQFLLVMLPISLLPAELLTAALLFALPLRHRPRFSLRIIVFASILCEALLCASLGALSAVGTEFRFSLRHDMLAFIISLTCSLITYGLAVILVFSCCEVSLSEAIYCATCAYLTQHFTYCLYRLCSPDLIEGDIGSYTLWYFVIYGLCYFLAGRFIARRIVSDGGYHTKFGSSLRLTGSALAMAIVLSAAAQQLQSQSRQLYIVCLLYAMFCCFFVVWGQLSQQRQMRLQHELDVQQQLWHQHKMQYEISSENVELIHRKCHDLKHQIAALKHISDEAQRDRSIRELEDAVMIYDSIVETGNDILDTVLTEKSLICEARGITLTCVADGACLSFMDAVDIYTMFGNALDNAIESVSRLTDPDKRVISVMVFAKSGLAFLQMENYCAAPLSFSGDLPETTKTEEKGYHGYGLKSIRYAAEKYGGFLTIQNEDDIFLLRVTIPQYE